MFEFLGEEKLDLGQDLGDYFYTFFFVDNDKDFNDLIHQHVMRLASCGYYLIHREVIENNVKLHKIVKKKMIKYNAPVSITFNNSGNVVDDSLNENKETGDPVHYYFMSHIIKVKSFQEKLAVSFKEGLLVTMFVNFSKGEGIFNTIILKLFEFTLGTSNEKYPDIVGSKEYTNKDNYYYNAFIDHCSQLIEKTLNIARYYYTRGEAYYKIDDKDNAINDLNKALLLDPENISASELIKMIRKEN